VREPWRGAALGVVPIDVGAESLFTSTNSVFTWRADEPFA
jgi:hypothetical protein